MSKDDSDSNAFGVFVTMLFLVLGLLIAFGFAIEERGSEARRAALFERKIQLLEHGCRPTPGQTILGGGGTAWTCPDGGAP